MNTNVKRACALLVAIGAIATVGAPFPAAVAQNAYSDEIDQNVDPMMRVYERATTLENLVTAFNGESNAHAKYIAFAKKADEEGYTKVASLFRAAARAEEIHAQNHAEVIKSLGSEAVADIKKFAVGTTRENLDVAIKGEVSERQVMYPAMIKRARTDSNRQAMRSFNFAMTAEAEHAKLYKDALANLEQWKGGTKDFYVCSVCGYTTTNLDFKKCASCFVKVDQYEKVN